MIQKYYTHPVTHKQFVVEVNTGITRQGNTCHIIHIHPCAGGKGRRFVRYSRGQYAVAVGVNLVPVALSSYYPGFSVRGLI